MNLSNPSNPLNLSNPSNPLTPLLPILVLSSIRGIGSIRARHLIDAFGSAEAVLNAEPALLLQAGAVGQMVIDGRTNAQLFDDARRELDFIEAHNIRPLVYGQEGYPKRLLSCPDAPTVLFKLGDTDLETKHVVSIVGTRQCTQYGRDIVHLLVKELHEALPEVIIVSGLALGIDVESHKAALENGVPTLGVVAHGLDRIYPYNHRGIAKQMIQQGGGLLTEYVTSAPFERGNFLARNRIIAGLADAIVVAESKEKGGSLVTASIALDYGRDVFAFPGRISDDRSNGCNRLIRLNRAGLITSAQDLLYAMNWQPTQQPQAIQQTLNFEEDHVSPLGRSILDILRDRGDLRLSQLSDILPDVERTALLEELLDLEMSDKIRNTPGGLYQLR
ncbi:MAG: DNA-processing protein DprA [Bacteroidales bacterium]|nr:DNA-processing protein DprA [Bacteroidales bacterium]